MTVHPRVLQLTATYGGGLAKHIISLARYLNPMKYDQVIMCPRVGDLFRLLSEQKIPAEFVEVKPYVDIPGDLQFFFQVYKYLRHCKFDVVHLHSTKAGIWGRLASHLAGVRHIVYTPNAYRFLAYPQGSLGRLLYVWIERLGSRWGTATLAVSNSELELTLMNRIARPANVFQVNNGVAIDELRMVTRDPNIRHNLGLPSGATLVTTVGRLHPQKSPDIFVRLALLLAERYSDVHFVMVGSGPLESRIRGLIRQFGLDTRIHIIHFTSYVPQLLLETSVFVMTSQYEGLSYAALEAAALGLPVVLSDVPGLKDVVLDGETGFLFPVGDYHLAASRVASLLDSPDRRHQFGFAGQQYSSQNFSIEKMAKGTEDVYDRLLGDSLYPR